MKAGGKHSHARFMLALFFGPEGGEMVCTSETLIDFQCTTCHYNPEDSILHNYHCVNLNPTILS
jgi:hypothetical protein